MNERKLRVAHVLVALGVGGMEKVVVDIIRRFDRARVRSSVYCVWKKGSLAEKLEKEGIPVEVVQSNGFPLNLAWQLARRFRQHRYDVVHSYSGVYRDAALAARAAGVPVIVHTDQGKFYPDSRWSRINHRICSVLRDQVTAVSDELKEFLVGEVGIPERKVIRIYNGVDPREHASNGARDQTRQALGIGADTPVIGIVARLSEVKNHPLLFHAFSLVCKECPRALLLVVGDGKKRTSLESLAGKLGITDRVRFLGTRRDVKELLHCMDIVCLSSRSEGLSLTLAEAMASAKPVVATAVGGNTELIRDGIDGRLVSPEHEEEMADALRELLGEKEKREQMGRHARERIREEFNLETIVKEYENVYLKLSGNKGRR
ncbi:MAG: glycosyltransferase [Candidatus Omnitrophica bacterium]|nr:glycosyltransferase [Candidatus Omnitrophota bacterium]